MGTVTLDLMVKDRQSIPGREHSMYKGYEVERVMAYSRTERKPVWLVLRGKKRERERVIKERKKKEKESCRSTFYYILQNPVNHI